MQCSDAREGISSRLDGEVPPPGDLDAHLAGCSDCREWADDAARLRRVPATLAGEVDRPAPVTPVAPPRGGTLGLGLGAFAALAVVVAVLATQGASRYTINGDTYPGALTSYGAGAGRLIATLAAAVTLGAIAFGVFRTAVQDTGDVGLRGYLAHRLAHRATRVWAVVSILMVPLSAADTSGQNLVDVWRYGGLWATIGASETAKGWFVSFVAAVVVLVGLGNALSWMAHLWLLLPAGLGVLAAVVTANEAQGPRHDYTTAALMALALTTAVWLGGLWAQAVVPWRDERRWTGVVFAVIALGYGAVIAVVMAPGSDLTETLYGRLVSAAGVLVALAGLLQWLRRTVPATVVLTVAAGVAIAASELTPPSFLVRRFTIGEVMLGYDVLDPPSVGRFLTLWRWDLNLVPLAVLLAGGYVWLVRRAGRRGVDTIQWPWYRTACFLFGCAALVVLSSSGVNTYATVAFSVHMVTHMLMTSLVPVFLLLGAPVTLLRTTLAPQWLERVLDSRSFAVLMRPAVQILLFALTLYGLYLTPLYDRIGRYHWGHTGIYLAVLVTGFLFYWRVFQIDPVPHRLPFIGRVGMLLAMMPISMFFAIIVMTMNGLIGPRLYQYLDVPWMTDLAHDQFVGGVVAWACDEAAIALVTVGLVLHWAWQSAREEESDDLV
ncbi:cytochrome c oxidase assembly protein [Tsukamurella sp. 8F]|uniref:cytochrome c oxidase assembly protein n=1 Tax=unclassified Tsukamurella TaxID=2633480 RepID=UPI0023B8B20B|nr:MULTISPECIES: cytochrome c oxidase assembly protein [unclassified Tsukamurella]MDF0530635.1 cytochrome c oxidase assembly protein [Tsukamurella sp. 8J]MDF0587836.1 cytochrome c oxidase assembly protein [Tsukamurella sp. 8F]